MKEVGKLLKEESFWYGSALVASNLKRVKGWWKNGDTKTAAGRQHIHIWSFSLSTLIDGLTDACRWLEKAASTTLNPVATGGKGRSYWLGSEAGRLGLYDGSVTLLASDGSAGETTL
eukprot:399217-Rhodomonas_salina.1